MCIRVSNSCTTFEKTPENLSTAILESLEEERNNYYRINIKKSKGEYSWLIFIKELEKL